jgi:hypothetical protein
MRVVREDEVRKGLLFAGTETGLYISFDGGANWKNFQRNLPVAPVTDIKIHRDNLIAATQGRSFWVLDELQSIRDFNPAATDKARLFPIPVSYRISGYSIFDSNGEETDRFPNTTGANPATGAVMYYHLPDNADSIKKLTISIKDAQGQVVRTFSNTAPKVYSNNGLRNEPVLTVKKGLNRFVWNMRRQSMPTIDEVYIEGSYAGGRMVPGTYFVELNVDGSIHSAALVIKADPRIDADAAAYAAQDELLKKLEADVTDIHVAVTRMRKLASQVRTLNGILESDDAKAELVKSGKSLLDKIKVWEEKLIQPKSQSYDDVINFVNKLSANIIFVHGEVNGTVPYVTAGQKARYTELHQQWLVLKTDMDNLLSTDIAAFNALCRKFEVSNILLPE